MPATGSLGTSFFLNAKDQCPGQTTELIRVSATAVSCRLRAFARASSSIDLTDRSFEKEVKQRRDAWERCSPGQKAKRKSRPLSISEPCSVNTINDIPRRHIPRRNRKATWNILRELVEQTTEMRGLAEIWRRTPHTVVHSSGQEATPEVADRTKRSSCRVIGGIGSGRHSRQQSWSRLSCRCRESKPGSRFPVSTASGGVSRRIHSSKAESRCQSSRTLLAPT